MTRCQDVRPAHRRRRTVIGALTLGVVLAGCGQPAGTDATSSTSTSPTVSALQRAQAALMTSAELPPAPPGSDTDAGLGHTAEGEAVSVPWNQVWLCSGAGRPDEGPPTRTEPGALAGAWGFGRAGSAQVDQYAIEYQDAAAAMAALARAREQAEQSCTDAITGNPEYVGDPPAIQIGAVPAPVDGLRVTATFTPDRGVPSDMVSTVMRSGATVQYLRVNEMSAVETEPGKSEPNPDPRLDPGYVDSLIAAAAGALTR